MKFLVILSTLMMGLSAHAGEILTCELSPKQTIKITKENNEYFFRVNKKKLSRLASAQTVQQADLKDESILLDIINEIGAPLSEVSRVNVYSLTKDDDGGHTIVRIIFNDNTYAAVYVSSAGLKPCL